MLLLLLFSKLKWMYVEEFFVGNIIRYFHMGRCSCESEVQLYEHRKEHHQFFFGLSNFNLTGFTHSHETSMLLVGLYTTKGVLDMTIQQYPEANNSRQKPPLATKGKTQWFARWNIKMWNCTFSFQRGRVLFYQNRRPL